jgi:hypothetical protein
MLEAVCDEASALLTHAATHAELLSAALPTVLATGDKALGLPLGVGSAADDVGRLQALRLTQPSSAELSTYLDQTRSALQTATAVVDAVYRLQLRTASSFAQVAPVLRDIGQVLGGHRRSGVTLRVEVDEPSPPSGAREASRPLVVAVPQLLHVKALVTLLAAAFEVAQSSDASLREVRMHAGPADNYVLFEIHLPGALGPWLQQADNSGDWETELSAVRRAAQNIGGELLIDSDLSETTMRLILPSELSDAAPESSLARRRLASTKEIWRPRPIR